MAKALDEIIESDFLVLGSGVAGLRAAIAASKKGKKVTLVTKSKQ